MAESRIAERRAGRQVWLVAIVLVTVAPIVLLPWLAPAGSRAATGGLAWLLVIGTSMHVASTGWFASVREVREMARHRPGRLFVVPLLIIAGAVGAAVLLSVHAVDTVLVGLFAWQVVHYQKQNLGLTALAARSRGVPGPSRGERRALLATSVGAAFAVIGRPQLLQVRGTPVSPLLSDLGAAVFVTAVLVGLILLRARPRSTRPYPFAVVFVLSLLFFTPLWLSDSPYAALAGLTVAHGLQYLLLTGAVSAGGRPGWARIVSCVVLVDTAVLGGLVLNRMSHQHGTDLISRCLFGAWMGVTAAHFVADSGLWRLRDPRTRAFLTGRLTFLLGQRPVTVPTESVSPVAAGA